MSVVIASVEVRVSLEGWDGPPWEAQKFAHQLLGETLYYAIDKSEDFEVPGQPNLKVRTDVPIP